MAKREIPRPELVQRYIDLRTESQADRLMQALKWEADPRPLAKLVRAAISTFEDFHNREECFCNHDDGLDAPTGIESGRDLLRGLATGGNPPGRWNVAFGRSRVKLRFLDYEVPPARTTANAPCFLNKFDGGGSSLLIKTDALLLDDDGTPVVAEAKVTKPKGYDTDSFLALVQALANACLFATADQRERFRRCYTLPSTPAAVDVALVLYKPPDATRATYQYRLDAAAWLLAHRLMRHPEMPPVIRRIMLIHAFGGPPLSLEGVALEPHP
jgi:hypothetical protein